MVTIGETAHPFAVSVRAKAVLLDSGTLTVRQTSRLLESISDDLKKYCDIITPDLLRPKVSQAARAIADANGIDLCSQSWHAQPQFDPGRKVFHVEHVVPIRSLRKACLAAADEADVLDILVRQIRIAWILKSEDRALSERGYRTQREDPDAAYEQAGIVLVDCHSS